MGATSFWHSQCVHNRPVFGNRMPNPPPATSATARPVCQRCLRPQRTCLCDLVPVIHSEVELVILQHPREVAHAKGTARLLHLGIPGSQLRVGEVFAAADVLSSERQNWLLFPDSFSIPAPLSSAPPSSSPPSTSIAPTEAANLRLIVPDGTWRKTRRMLHDNPFLQVLPRAPLPALPASAYRIRKAEAEYQLSTLEATCLALASIEKNSQRYQPLLDALVTFVQRYQHYVPST